MTNPFPLWKQAYAGGRTDPVSETIATEDLLLGTLSIEWVGSQSSDTRILVFSSHYDASVEISFIRPARFYPDGICLAVVDEARLKTLAESGLETLFSLMRPTHVIFCRYWGEHYEQITAFARRHGTATLSFLDDNLLEVPVETGQSTYAHFEDAARRAVILRTIEDVDLFVPSTPLLADVMHKYRKGAVAEWSIYRSVTPDEFTVKLPRRAAPTVGYMGSGSHITDVEVILPALLKLLNKRPDVRLEFFGTIKPPAALNTFGDRVVGHGKADSYGDFIVRLQKLGWWVGLAPLTNSPFNKTKASTKWVEYTAAGIATIATSADVYGAPASKGALVLSSPDEYLAAIEALLDDSTRRAALVDASRTLLANAYSVAAHSQNLRQALEQATELAAHRITTNTAEVPQARQTSTQQDMTVNS
jgi:glycosyltransferase involved in cell wall biosynthesis